MAVKLGLTLREELQSLRVFENKVLRKIYGAKRDEVTGEWRKLHNAELHAMYPSPDIIRNIKSRRLRWAGHVARMGESRNAYRVLVGRPVGKRPLGRPRRRWEDNIKMDLREVGYDGRDRITMAGLCEGGNEPPGSLKANGVFRATVARKAYLPARRDSRSSLPVLSVDREGRIVAPRGSRAKGSSSQLISCPRIRVAPRASVPAAFFGPPVIKHDSKRPQHSLTTSSSFYQVFFVATPISVLMSPSTPTPPFDYVFFVAPVSFCHEFLCGITFFIHSPDPCPRITRATLSVFVVCFDSFSIDPFVT
ncbi:hypothetical protein ANN_18234 [Periplaneta americana]|uniref:Uncharacterized protein n=1 Tax=Periplaneta americana TaxID=6978 RepID=A0ABQ8SNS6_PERAM|nr:hypothetical protein ANN_18234 [Periplaneta americana]